MHSKKGFKRFFSVLSIMIVWLIAGSINLYLTDTKIVFAQHVTGNTQQLLDTSYLQNNSIQNVNEISRSFELRYVTNNPKANGITDFKGENEIFDTDQRIKFLKTWGNYAKKFSNDVDLTKQAISENEIKQRLLNLKSQPMPEVRRIIPLDNWKYMGYRNGQREEEIKKIDSWLEKDGVLLQNGHLVLSEGTFKKKFEEQTWRFNLSWTVEAVDPGKRVSFYLTEHIEVGFNEAGSIYFMSDGEEITNSSYQPGEKYNFKIEVDIDGGSVLDRDKDDGVPATYRFPETGRFSFYVNEEMIADFVPFSKQPETDAGNVIGSFTIDTKSPIKLYSIYGMGFHYDTGHGVREYPFSIHSIIDENFSVRDHPEGFYYADYDDKNWDNIPYERYAHGGERYKGEALYLRQKVEINRYKRAILNIETVRPSADIYINGNFVKKVGRHPENVDITDYLEEQSINLIAVRVDPYKTEIVRDHMSSDPYTGWFAGLMHIELTENEYIDDVFAYTAQVDNGATLRVKTRLGLKNDDFFKGKLITRVYPWFPEESNDLHAESIFTIELQKDLNTHFVDEVFIPKPKLWSYENPHLYKVHVILTNQDGIEVDDFVLTTGLRTIDQEGGIFRINGQPQILKGPLLFGHHYPLEHIAQWMFSPPKERWIHDILLTKKMNGNAIRMSVHDRLMSGVNDPRLARIGDQLGIMFIWQTPAWVRTESIEGFDFEGLPKFVEKVRNHPSIVMWQPGNHPHNYPLEWFQKVFEVISDVDKTRLISPAADMSHMRREFTKTIGNSWYPAEDDSTISSWRSPLLARGTMERVLGYGQEWKSLREFPGMHEFRGMEYDVRMEYLNSTSHAWFDFESEETIGQPNWKNYRGKPYYKMYSYEKSYDIGSIGRILRFDEWLESQAWQALSLYEGYRKKRWFNFDGIFWCPLRGGGNTATYMKPLVDYHNIPKLSFYAAKMVFQNVLAGSKNVDIVYGPNDVIPLMILQTGPEKIVNLKIVVRDMSGQIIAEKEIDNIYLPEGRSTIELGDWKPEITKENYYAFEYVVYKASD